MGRLAGKVAIITGAAQGQGAAEAQLFAEEGATVIVADIAEDLGGAVAERLGPSASFLRLDVSDEASWQHVVDETVRRFGAVDVLINNAAVLHMASIEGTTVADFERVVRVNQIGPFLGMRTVIGPMKAQGRGSIVNVASVDGVVGMNGVVAYSATKFAIRGLTKVGALEFGRYGVRVNTLVPGGVDTQMGKPPEAAEVTESSNAFFAEHPVPRIGQPRELAYAALFLASDESSYVAGAELVVDGGQIVGSRVPGVPGY